MFIVSSWRGVVHKFDIIRPFSLISQFLLSLCTSVLTKNTSLGLVVQVKVLGLKYYQNISFTIEMNAHQFDSGERLRLGLRFFVRNPSPSRI